MILYKKTALKKNFLNYRLIFKYTTLDVPYFNYYLHIKTEIKINDKSEILI